MGNTNSTEGNNLVASYQQKKEQQSQIQGNTEQDQPPQRERRTSSSSTASNNPKPTSNSTSTSSSTSSISKKPQSFEFSVTEPIHAVSEPEPIPPTTHHWSPKEPSIQEDSDTMKEGDKEPEQPANTPSKAVPVSNAKSGWVSSTGAASPWYGSLSSSTSSSHHRASISGPYYRTRGMSVTRDSENDEDLTNIITSTSSNTAANSINSTQQTSPTTSTQAASNAPTTATAATATATTNQGVPTIITWTQGGNNVYITGTFNGWKHKIRLVKSTHDFSAVLDLPPGTHRLKFIVDDEWKCSNDMETATDPDGNLVNYLQVLDEDDEENNDEFGDNDLSTVSSSGSLSMAESKKYSNVIPPELLQLASVMSNNDQKDDEEVQQQRKTLLEWEKKQPQPPGLPPHLEKVLLNSHTVSEEDNSVLQEPNHVTLNHLYACSIKDNVMALATTSRYRKKVS
ncbi:5'-AMP-activated protein kinase subunit beta-2 [Mucor ambiguus]|uniref:5'-AMP-activated protein kinase subunit beta-2 n=1 Tax=Mucor ambiguus TaxID=91626 RepID=A0A0C9MF04_9FUNG|nr:5'-AMP-activated protein kinase subunit beta-2 [Mucor ambiguus]